MGVGPAETGQAEDWVALNRRQCRLLLGPKFHEWTYYRIPHAILSSLERKCRKIVNSQSLKETRIVVDKDG